MTTCDVRPGDSLNGFCRTCDHPVLTHRRDHSCVLCDLPAMIRTVVPQLVNSGPIEAVIALHSPFDGVPDLKCSICGDDVDRDPSDQYPCQTLLLLGVKRPNQYDWDSAPVGSSLVTNLTTGVQHIEPPARPITPAQFFSRDTPTIE